MERVSELIDQAGEMFSTLDPEIANSIISMSISIAFLALPILLFILMFFRTLAIGIKNAIVRSNYKAANRLNQAIAKTVPEIPLDDNTDTQPINLYAIRQSLSEKKKETDEILNQETTYETFVRLQKIRQDALK